MVENVKSNNFHSLLQKHSQCGFFYHMHLFYINVHFQNYIGNLKYYLIFYSPLYQCLIFSMTDMSHNFTVFTNFYTAVATSLYDI